MTLNIYIQGPLTNVKIMSLSAKEEAMETLVIPGIKQ